jgi:hypothetical protein
MRYFLLLGVLLLGGAAVQSSAATFSFSTPTGAKAFGGTDPVGAEALFVVNGNQLQITLENLQTNTKQDGQTLDALTFQLSSAIPQGATIQSMTMSGVTAINIPSKTSPYQVETTNIPAWNLSDSIGGNTYTFSFCNIDQSSLGCKGQGNDWPKGNIIGPAGAGDKFSNANSSITNGAHYPFIYQQAVFTITLSNGQFNTNPADYKNVVFGFGTSSSFSQTAGVQSVQPAPEPTAFSLAAIGFGLGLFTLRRKRR